MRYGKSVARAVAVQTTDAWNGECILEHPTIGTFTDDNAPCRGSSECSIEHHNRCPRPALSSPRSGSKDGVRVAEGCSFTWNCLGIRGLLAGQSASTADLCHFVLDSCDAKGTSILHTPRGLTHLTTASGRRKSARFASIRTELETHVKAR